MAARRGRGRLSSIELLPDWAAPAVTAAYAKLRENKLTQLEIHEAFNAELRTLAFAEGITDPPQISLSAFNRRSMRLATLAQRLAETREIASVLASRLEDGGDEDLTLMASETIKTIVFEALENGGTMAATPMSAEMMANFALALKSAEQAKKVTADTKALIQKNFAKVAEAVDSVARAKGLTRDTVDAIKTMVLGIAP
jgi:orotate phosphoribosyltransferase-like protein